MAVAPDIVGQFVDAVVGNHALANKLLRQHPDLRSAKWCGESLLRFLAIEDHSDGVRFLVQYGWMVDERENDGTTALIDAVRAGARRATLTLLELGADPNTVSDTYDNPLHCAISLGNTTMVLLLLENGANPAYTTDLGETAFDVIPNKADKNAEIRAILKKHGL